MGIVTNQPPPTSRERSRSDTDRWHLFNLIHNTMGTMHDIKTYTPTINNEGDGEHFYRIDLWCGSGYLMLPFWVYADVEQDAIDRLFEWCAARGNEYKPWVFDYETAVNDGYDVEELTDLISNSDCTLFARSQEFRISQ